MGINTNTNNGRGPYLGNRNINNIYNRNKGSQSISQFYKISNTAILDAHNPQAHEDTHHNNQHDDEGVEE